MDGQALALACREYADDKKAENLLVLDVREVSSITDYFVIATGNSEPHVRAIWTDIAGRLQKDHAMSPPKPEGDRHNQWVVLDYYDVIVHVMLQSVRDQYDLEGLWNDAALVGSATV